MNKDTCGNSPSSIVLTLETSHTSPTQAAWSSLWEEKSVQVCGFISKATFTQLQTALQFTNCYLLPPNIPIMRKYYNLTDRIMVLPKITVNALSSMPNG